MPKERFPRVRRQHGGTGTLLQERPARPERLTGAKALIPLLLVSLGVLAYCNAFSGPFIIDDKASILENPNIRRLWPVWRAASPPDSTVARRPIVSLSLAINYAVSGLDVWSYHAFNLTVHVLAALVLFGIVRRALVGDAFRNHYAGEASWLAMALALVWMLHPLQTEAVTYLIQRTELLMGLFFLLTLYCVIRGAAAVRPAWWFAAAVASCALGMGSKEVMVSAPPIVLLYDRVFLSRSLRDSLWKRPGLYAGVAATWLVLAGLVWANPQSRSVGLGFRDLTPWDYAKTQCGVILHYLRLSFWPHPLVIDYTGWPVARTAAMVLPSATVVLALLAATLWALHRRPSLGFLGAWFFLILAPTSSFLPIVTEIAAERRMYLPLAAVVAVIVIGAHEALKVGLRRLTSRTHWHTYIEAGVLVAALAALCSATLQRNEDYRSEIAILTDLATKRPQNVRAHYNLGLVLDQGGQTSEAIREFSEAVRLNPRFAPAQLNLAVALAKQRQVTEAIARSFEYLRINPNDVDAHTNLGVFLASQGRFEEAISHYSEALRTTPSHPNAHMNLGNALRDQGKLDEAVAHYSEALRAKPNDDRTHYYLGAVLAKQGRIGEATRHFEAALKVNPSSQRARHALEELRLGSGQIGSPP